MLCLSPVQPLISLHSICIYNWEQQYDNASTIANNKKTLATVEDMSDTLTSLQLKHEVQKPP